MERIGKRGFVTSQTDLDKKGGPDGDKAVFAGIGKGISETTPGF